MPICNWRHYPHTPKIIATESRPPVERACAGKCCIQPSRAYDMSLPVPDDYIRNICMFGANEPQKSLLSKGGSFLIYAPRDRVGF